MELPRRYQQAQREVSFAETDLFYLAKAGILTKLTGVYITKKLASLVRLAEAHKILAEIPDVFEADRNRAAGYFKDAAYLAGSLGEYGKAHEYAAESWLIGRKVNKVMRDFEKRMWIKSVKNRVASS